MGQKAKYRSALRSRRLIREAFLQLLKEKDVNKITVTDIVKLADINRTTFYAHYPDVHGVIEEIENEIIEKMITLLDSLKFKNFISDITPLLKEINNYLEENVDYCRTLLLTKGSETFLEELQKLFADYLRNDTEIPESIRQSKSFSLHVCYFTGGIVYMYKQWFLGNPDFNLDDISEEIGRIVTASVTDLMGISSS